MANFDGERGRENGHAESVCAVSPGDARSEGPLGLRELGPATATGGRQTVGQTSEVASTRSGILGMAVSVLAALAIRAHHRASEKPSSDGTARDSSCIGAGNPEEESLDAHASNA